MVEILEKYDNELVTGLITLLVALIIWLLQSRVNLVWGQKHGFVHTINTPQGAPFPLYTSSYIISNIGQKTASNVEVTLNYKPEEFGLFPEREFRITDNPHGKYIITFSTFAPKEWVSIDLLMANVDTPGICSVRSMEALGKEVELQPVRKLSKAQEIGLFALLFWGVASLIYAIVMILN